MFSSLSDNGSLNERPDWGAGVIKAVAEIVCCEESILHIVDLIMMIETSEILKVIDLIPDLVHCRHYFNWVVVKFLHFGAFVSSRLNSWILL